MAEKDDKKDKKEKKEKKEKKDGEKKKKKRDDSDDEGVSMWDSVGEIKNVDLTKSDNYLTQQSDKALDKRNKADAKAFPGKKIAVGGSEQETSSVVADLLKRKEKEQKAKAAEKEKNKAEREKAKDLYAGLDDGAGEKDRSEEELDLKGESLVSDKLGNRLEGRVVHDYLATGTFKTLRTDVDLKLAPSVRNVGTGAVRAGGATEEEFLSLGRFTPASGHGFLRISAKATSLTVSCIRPTSIFVLSREEIGVDAGIKKWSSLADPTGEAGVETTLGYYGVIKTKKILKDEELTFTFETKTMGSYLVFFLPDFNAKTFAADFIAQQAEDDEATGTPQKSVGLVVDARNDKTLDEKVADLKERQARGEKLTAKEKKMLERHTQEVKYSNPDDEENTGDLKAFSIVLPGGKLEHPPSGDAAVVEGFSLSAAGNWLFKNANFKVVQGHRYGFLGPNGMGKTTLLRHIAKRELPIPLDWDILLVEQEARASNKNVVEEVMAADVACVQLLDEEKELMEKLENDSASPEEMEKARARLEEVSAELDARNANALESTVRKILTGLGFTKKMQTQTVETFSGGWRMRISLAKALFMQPKLLLLDEPTNHLDLDAVLWLDNYLAEEYPHTVICVSHDADFLDAICTDIIHLDQQKLFYYRGGYRGFRKMLGQKKLEKERELKKMQDEFKALKRSGIAKDKAEETIKRKFHLESINDIHEKIKDYIVKFNFIGLGQDSAIGGLNVSDVAFSYNGKKPYLLDELDFGCDTTSRIAIVGPNGVGKSTFLNLMLKKLEPLEGEVRHANQLRIGHYHQHFDELLPLDKNGVEYLMSDFSKAGITSQERARASLGQFGLPSFAHLTKIGNLSGGQKARVAFAALSLSQPHIVVLDEPTNHLDIESVEALIDALDKYDGGVILVTHDARLIQAVDCTLWVVALHDPTVKPETAQIKRHERGFEGYRQDVLGALADREEEIEAMARQRAAEREEKRKKLGVTVREVEVQTKKAVAPRVKSRGAGGDEDEDAENGDAGAGDQDGSPSGGNKKKKMTAKERQMMKKEQAKKDTEDAATAAAAAQKEAAAAEAAEEKARTEREAAAGMPDQLGNLLDNLPDIDDDIFAAKKKKKKKKQVDSDEEEDSDEDAKKKKKKRSTRKTALVDEEDAGSDGGEKKKKKKSRREFNLVEDDDEDTARKQATPRSSEEENKAGLTCKMKDKFDAVEEEEKPKAVEKEESQAPPAKKDDSEKDDDEDEDDSDSEVDLAAFAKKPQAKKQPAKQESDGEDESEDDEVDLAAFAKGGKKNFDPPSRGSRKGSTNRAAKPESEDEEEEESTPPSARDSKKNKYKGGANAKAKEQPAATSSASSTSSPRGSPSAEEAKPSAPEAKPSAVPTKTEFKIGKVTLSETMKKKGTYQLEIDVGAEEVISIVTSTFESVPDEGAIVVVVPEGVKGPDGKEVKRSKVAGAWNCGALLSCLQLGLDGTAKDVGVLDPEVYEAKIGHFYETEETSSAGGARPAAADASGGQDDNENDDGEQDTAAQGRESTKKGNKRGKGGGAVPAQKERLLPPESGENTANPSQPGSDEEDNAPKGAAAGGQKMGAAAKKRAKKAAAAADDDGGAPAQGGGGNKPGGNAGGAAGKKARGTANITLEEEAPINWDSDDGKKKRGGKKKK